MASARSGGGAQSRFDGVTDAAVGFDSCISQIIESAQDVVVPKLSYKAISEY